MKINGEQRYLWRAVDHEREILESFITKIRDRKIALTGFNHPEKRLRNGPSRR